MSTNTLGRLDPVELRDVWAKEADSFTPWLAQKENLAVLGKAIGIELEFEAQEKSIGTFRADIICKDIETGSWVLIENQLERTDHRHLGQLLTYASGLQAVASGLQEVTIIWIAARFTDEHRSTLDWLNKITDNSFRFFGLEIELWRIGESHPAPKFNIVSKPNDWSRSFAQEANAIDKAGLSETRQLQLGYWTRFQDILNKTGGPVSSNQRPRPRSYLSCSIGRSGFFLFATMLRRNKRIRAELYLSGQYAKAYISLLKEQKDEIENEIGYPLEYELLEGRRDSRISIYLDNVDVEDQQDWERQHNWLVERLNEFHHVFSKRISKLDPDDWDEDEIDETDS